MKQEYIVSHNYNENNNYLIFWIVMVYCPTMRYYINTVGDVSALNGYINISSHSDWNMKWLIKILALPQRAVKQTSYIDFYLYFSLFHCRNECKWAVSLFLLKFRWNMNDFCADPVYIVNIQYAVTIFCYLKQIFDKELQKEGNDKKYIIFEN